jgi:hypothetical protein
MGWVNLVRWVILGGLMGGVAMICLVVLVQGLMLLLRCVMRLVGGMALLRLVSLKALVSLVRLVGSLVSSLVSSLVGSLVGLLILLRCLMSLVLLVCLVRLMLLRGGMMG